MRLTLAIGVMFVLFGARPLVANTLYIHSFADLHDVTVVQGAPTLTPNVPVPGGKDGIALQFDDAPGSDGAAALTPAGVLFPPTGETVTFRIFITSKSNFMATYLTPSGEGLRFLDGGGLQESRNGTALLGSWAFNNWYTVRSVFAGFE